MEEIIKRLEETDKIYDTKLDDAIKALKEMDVKDEQFDKLLNRVSSLISLKLQKENFIEEYEMRKAQKEMEVKQLWKQNRISSVERNGDASPWTNIFNPLHKPLFKISL